MAKKNGRTVYKDSTGMKVPGVTTITGGELGWNKQILIAWANKLGLSGTAAAGYVDNLAEIGTLAHQMVLDHFKGVKSDTSDHSENQINLAENCLLSYFAWEKGKEIKPILMEQPLVSELLKFGGTPDMYAEINGRKTLLDFKTGKGGIYDEYKIQVAGGYLCLLEEKGYSVEDIVILNIPRAESEAFTVQSIPADMWDPCKKIFLNCLNNYNLKKLLKGE